MSGKRIILWKCYVEPYGYVYVEAVDVKEASLNAMVAARSLYEPKGPEGKFEVISVQQELERVSLGVWLGS